MPDPKSIGQDRQYNDATDAYDAEYGTYEDSANGLAPDAKLPVGPQGADPSPFKLGPTGTGGE